MKAAQAQSSDGFQANLQLVENEHFDGASIEQIGAAARSTDHPVVFIADAVAIGREDKPILCINASAPERMFRVGPSELWSVENNLSLANLDFDDYADAVATDGVFRGF